MVSYLDVFIIKAGITICDNIVLDSLASHQIQSFSSVDR